MNGSLQRLTALSLLIHVIFFGTMLLTLKHSNHFVIPSPYIVNLVAPEARRESGNTREDAPKIVESSSSETRYPALETSKKPKTQSRREEKYLSERIAALEAKKKIERIVGLRGIISLRGYRGENKPVPLTEPTARGKGYTVDNYELIITKEIQQHWVFPEIGDKNIEAIVSIKIMKNGSVQIKEIEKKSGNRLFDRSAIRAITDASPLTPPPYEMEIGVKFHP